MSDTLKETGLELEDIYRGNHTWTELRRTAGMSVSAPADNEATVGRGIARLLHIDDQERIDALDQILAKKLADLAAEKDSVIAEKEEALAEKDAEIAALKSQLGKA